MIFQNGETRKSVQKGMNYWERLNTLKVYSQHRRMESHRIQSPKKMGEPRNQVPEEGFESEEGSHEIFKISPNFFKIYQFWLNYAK